VALRTLFLHPPSFEGFDGGAGSRYQARREIRSFWYPTWLAQPAALVPGSKLVITGEAGADPRSYRVDFSRFRTAIPGFDIEWTVKRGALELADAYQKFGLTKEAFDQRFTRLAVLRAASEAGAVDDTLRWRR